MVNLLRAKKMSEFEDLNRKGMTTPETFAALKEFVE